MLARSRDSGNEWLVFVSIYADERKLCIIDDQNGT